MNNGFRLPQFHVIAVTPAGLTLESFACKRETAKADIERMRESHPGITWLIEQHTSRGWATVEQGR